MDEPTVVDPAGPASGGGMSQMDRIRAERAQLAGRKTVTITLPGYQSPKIVAKYRLLTSEADDLDGIGVRVKEQFESDADRMLYGMIDLLIMACEGLYIREPGESALEALDPDGLGAMTYSDQRLDAFMGFKATTARQRVMEMFVGNEFALLQHAGKFQEWLADTSTVVDEESLGESRAAG